MASSEALWHPSAVVDVWEARAWYLSRSALAARGFVLAVDRAVGEVVAAAERWPVIESGCRRYVFPNRYPYALVCRVGQAVEIVAVTHQRRRPGFWSNR